MWDRQLNPIGASSEVDFPNEQLDRDPDGKNPAKIPLVVGLDYWSLRVVCCGTNPHKLL